jgi:hypothetical protein
MAQPPLRRHPAKQFLQQNTLVVATGGGAKFVLFLRYMLSDRAFDGVLRHFSKQAQKTVG